MIKKMFYKILYRYWDKKWDNEYKKYGFISFFDYPKEAQLIASKRNYYKEKLFWMALKI